MNRALRDNIETLSARAREDAINAPRDYMVVRKVLGDGGTLDPVRAADPQVSLKDLMKG